MTISEEEKLDILYDCYYIKIEKDLKKREFNKIYNQKDKIIEIYFEYKVTVDNEIIEIIINEKYNYYVIKRLWFLGEILLKEVKLE